MQLYEINICPVRIFRLYTAYNKHGMIKNGNQTSKKKKKSQVQAIKNLKQSSNPKYQCKGFTA